MAPSLRALAIADVVLGAIVAATPWVALPGRIAIVDAGATAIGVLHVAAGAGLLLRRGWAVRLARTSALLLLVLGIALLAGLAVSASFLYGVYGDVGRGGAFSIAVAIVVLLPYLVAFPIVELIVLRAARFDAPADPPRKRRAKR